jgi:uncharacterized protein YukJ
MDSVTPSKKEMLSMDSKITLLGPRKDVDEIIEAIVKVAKNTDKLA